MSLRHTENLTSGKDSGTGEGGLLMMKERMKDTDVAKFDINAKSDVPDASDASNGSNIDNTKVNVNREIVKP